MADSPSLLPADLAPLPGDIDPADLLRGVLDVSLTALQLLRPIYAPDGAAIVDFSPEYTNPAGLRMLGFAQQPRGRMLDLFPHTLANGIFAYYQRAFAASEPLSYELNYQSDGLDNYFRVQAQRQGALLLVSFTDTSDQTRSAVEQALRNTQAAEQAARAEAEAQRQRFQEVLMQLPAYVAVYHGPDHVYEFVNPPYQSMFPHRAFPGRTFGEAMPEAHGLGVVALFDRVYQTGEPFIVQEMEGWFDFKGTGEPEQVFLNLYLLPLRNAQGQVDGVLDYSHNVTEQVRARQEREAQRTELQNIFEQAPIALARLRGPEFVVEWANTRMTRMWDRPLDQLVGRPHFEALPDLAGQGLEAVFAGVWHTGQPHYSHEALVSLAHAQQPYQGYFNITFQPTYDEPGHVTGLLASAVDVTEQVEARRQVEQLNAELEARVQARTQELAQAQAETEAQRQRLRQLIAEAPALIAVLRGPEHRVELANDGFHAIFGGRELVGKTYREAIPEFASQSFFDLLDKVYRTGETYHGIDEPVTLDRTNSGQLELTYITFIYQATRDFQGQIDGILVFCYEVTDQVLARRQVQDLNEELMATNQELHGSNTQLTRTNVDLDNFIYTASHDLKAPITNIEGLLLALEEELPEAGRTGDVPLMLTLMQEAVDRFRRTIAHLTDLSRLQKEHSPERDMVALAPVVDAVRLDLTPLLATTQGRLTVAVPADLTVTFAEKNLRSVVYNLLSNAFKYHHPDRRPAVALRSWAAGDHVVLEVQDNGLGLDLSQGQGKLFAMFQRLHTHVEGTGIGLYMVKRVLENAGGRIEVESQLGQGTTFRVYFLR